MQTLVYRGKEISGLLSQIRKEHGDDAIIVSTKEIKRDLVEVQIRITARVQAEKAQAPDRQQPKQSPELNNYVVRNCKAQGLNDLNTQKLLRIINDGALQNLTDSQKFLTAMGSLFPIDYRLPLRSKFVALIGATGVGKTTTIAKIAARMRMSFNMKIALVSADYYRVGAGYQLQTYAGLMKLPYKALEYSSDMCGQLQECLHAFSDFDLVLIDAAGFSPYQDNRLLELHTLFSKTPSVERMLLLPAPGNEFDLAQSVRKFGLVGYERVIISKLDESGFIGPVLNTVSLAGKPLSFITNGQRVPEDIEPGSLKRLSQNLMRTLH